MCSSERQFAVVTEFGKGRIRTVHRLLLVASLRLTGLLVASLRLETSLLLGRLLIAIAATLLVAALRLDGLLVPVVTTLLVAALLLSRLLIAVVTLLLVAALLLGRLLVAVVALLLVAVVALLLVAALLLGRLLIAVVALLLRGRKVLANPDLIRLDAHVVMLLAALGLRPLGRGALALDDDGNAVRLAPIQASLEELSLPVPRRDMKPAAAVLVDVGVDAEPGEIVSAPVYGDGEVGPERFPGLTILVRLRIGSELHPVLRDHRIEGGKRGRRAGLGVDEHADVHRGTAPALPLLLVGVVVILLIIVVLVHKILPFSLTS